MSPFIRRVVVDEPETSAGKISTPHEFYVARNELRHGDVVLDPNETDRASAKFIRPAILAGLAVQFPKEFAAAARAREIDTSLPGEQGNDDDDPAAADDDGPDDETLKRTAERAASIVAMNADDAITAIGGTEDLDILAAVRELEEANKGRATVLRALDAKES